MVIVFVFGLVCMVINPKLNCLCIGEHVGYFGFVLFIISNSKLIRFC